MGDVVNLRSVRKRKARDGREKAAAENRALHGRSKAGRLLSDSIRDDMKARHDAHRRENRPPDDRN